MNYNYIKSMIIPVLMLSGYFSISLHANEDTTINDKPNPAQLYLERVSKEEWINQASAAVLATTVSGDTLAFLNEMKMLIPASTMKAVTTGAAIHSCGPDFKFETALAYSGKIVDGILKGDIYIVGGGDPTTGSKDSIATPVNKLFAVWKKFIADAGIKHIDGRVIGDDRYFDRCAEIGSWQWNDTGTYYGTGVSGLSFYENKQNINISPGDTPGKPLEISLGYPELPWMEYDFYCTTGKEGTGNSLYLYTSPFAPKGEMRGTLAIDRKTKTEQVSNKFPAYTCAWHFRKYLTDNGIHCTGDAADTGPVFGIPVESVISQDSLIFLGSTYSPALKRIIYETNHQSNNLFAETLFKTLGKEYCGQGTYESGRYALAGILNELGANTETGCKIEDGSGLSRQNSISPEFMCRFLKAMIDSEHFEDYVETLPHPGGNGTLANIMTRYPDETTGRIRMKSGSMNGVKCYCGYIIPTEGSKDEITVFSIMINNYFGSNYKLQTFLDRLIYLIACEN